MSSILLMFSSEINISATVASWGSGLFALDLSDGVCNLSERAHESTDALPDDRPAISSAGWKKNTDRLDNETSVSKVI